MKIISLTEDSLLGYGIDGVKNKTASKIIESIKSKLATASLGDFAAATPYFNSMAKKRMNVINAEIPDWLDLSNDELNDKIVSLSGFSEKTASVIVSGKDHFREFFNNCKTKNIKICAGSVHKSSSTKIESNLLSNKIFLFTGFRDKVLKEKILANGGEVKDTLTKKITHLIIPCEDFSNGKVTKAIEAGITIVSKDNSMFSM